ILRGGLQQSAATLDVRRCKLLFEVGESRVEAGGVTALGGEQRRPGLCEAGADLPIAMRCLDEVSTRGCLSRPVPEVPRMVLSGSKNLVGAAQLDQFQRQVIDHLVVRRRERLAEDVFCLGRPAGGAKTATGDREDPGLGLCVSAGLT